MRKWLRIFKTIPQADDLVDMKTQSVSVGGDVDSGWLGRTRARHSHGEHVIDASRVTLASATHPSLPS